MGTIKTPKIYATLPCIMSAWASLAINISYCVRILSISTRRWRKPSVALLQLLPDQLVVNYVIIAVTARYQKIVETAPWKCAKHDRYKHNGSLDEGAR